jgi:glutamine cyclotransferase
MIQKIVLLIFAAVLFNSCEKDYEFKFETPKNLKSDKKFTANVSVTNGLVIDSVLYSLNGKTATKTATFDFTNERLGKHVISAIVFYGKINKKLTNTIINLAQNEPVVYTYEIVNEYPHDDKAFTQGLELYKGFLYESTGSPGRNVISSLRKTELKTGKVLKKIELDKKYFAEGLTIFNHKIYQLTWQAKEGFIYDMDFNLEKKFKYGKSQQGWGLTHDNAKLIKTDGSERMWFLNPETLKEERFIETYSSKTKVEKLNELEFVKGQIYANVWQKNIILMVNPKNGAIEGVLNLEGLQKKVERKGQDNVLNGIAYDAENDKLYVTGKNWNTLFEIKVIKKQ